MPKIKAWKNTPCTHQAQGYTNIGVNFKIMVFTRNKASPNNKSQFI